MSLAVIFGTLLAIAFPVGAVGKSNYHLLKLALVVLQPVVRAPRFLSYLSLCGAYGTGASKLSARRALMNA